MSRIQINTDLIERWSISAEAADGGRVWLHVFAGPTSGGLFTTPAQARAIAHTLITAADAAEASMRVEEEA